MWWDAPPSTRNVESALSTSPSTHSPSNAGGMHSSSTSAASLLRRNFLVGVTMRSREVWVSVNAATVDELCAQVEAEMTRTLGLTYMELLYMTCTTDAARGGDQLQSSSSWSPSVKRQKSFAGTDDARLFSLCARNRKRDTERTLQRKGRAGRVPLIHDDLDASDVQEVFGGDDNSERGSRKIVYILPPKFSCVARCVPRSIHFTVYCLLTSRARLAFSPSYGSVAALTAVGGHHSGSAAAAVPSTDQDIIFRVPPSSEEAELLLQFPEAGRDLVCARGVAQDVTSLTEFSIGIMDVLRQAIQDNRAVDGLSQSMALYFFNPRDKYTTHRCYVPLLHVSQLSGLTCILCDAVGQTDDGTAGSLSTASGSRGTLSRQLKFAEVDAATSEKAFTAGNGVAVLQALKQRRLGVDAARDMVSSPSLVHSSSPPRSSSPSSPPRSRHMHRLGISSIGNEVGDSSSTPQRHHGPPALAKRREEFEDGVSVPEAEDPQHDLRLYANSIAGDALLESQVRFPYDIRTSQWRRGNNGGTTGTPPSHFLTTPPPIQDAHTLTDPSTSTSVAMGASGRLVVRRESTTPADEKRALIQIALHMLLSHPKRGMFPTSNLVTLIPNIVQAFRQDYTPGVPLRFPLSQRDTQDLRAVVDDCVAYEIASNPNLPLLLEGGSSSPRHEDAEQRNNAQFPSFAEVDLSEGVRADVPPMVDRLPSAPPSAQSILILTKPFFEPMTKRLLVYATIGVDIFDGASSALHQSNRPYHHHDTSPSHPGSTPSSRQSAAAASGMAALPFRWFLRTTVPSTDERRHSRELPIETFFALGLAKTQVMSYSVPITVGLELFLNASQDWSYIAEGQERVLVHRWRAGGVANILEEGQTYIVGIEIRRPDVPMEVVGVRGAYVQATQAFAIPLNSGIAPTTRGELYGMMHQ